MSPSSDPLSIRSLDPRRPIEAIFRWTGDRWAHQIVAPLDGSPAPLLESLEGEADDPWPPAPPLQSASIERPANHPIACLVGAAGCGYWSLTCEPTSDGLLFDVACRLANPAAAAAPFIGSTYARLGRIWPLETAPSASCRGALPSSLEDPSRAVALPGALRIEPRSSGGSPAPEIRLSDRGALAIAAAQTADRSTRRWSYFIGLSHAFKPPE